MIRTFCLMIAVVVFAAGCGYKGPLVLPEKSAGASEPTSKESKPKKP